MENIPDRDSLKYKEGNQLRTARWLVHAKATNGFKSPDFWIILALLAAFTYVYYNILTDYHDIYLVIFFYPLIYAAIAYRLRGVVISGLVVLGILLPQVFLFGYDSYALLRVLLFAVFTFLISGLGATLLNYLEQQLEAFDEITSLNEKLNSYIDRLESTRKQLIQSEKLNAIGQLAASVAHEINNPLGGVLVYSKLLLKKLKGDSFDKKEAAHI